MPLALVRKPPIKVKRVLEFRDKDDTEVFSKAAENEPFCWWCTKIVTQRGELFVVKFKGFDDSLNVCKLSKATVIELPKCCGP